ncbi:Eco57I restriction-modification methylase domain-containing protein [Streptomyces sp. NPDC002172]
MTQRQSGGPNPAPPPANTVPSGTPHADADAPKIDLHRLHPVVSEVARWCRGATVEPLSEELVPGTNERERRQLAALGGVARALSDDLDQVHNAQLPPPVVNWLKTGSTPPLDLIENLRSSLSNHVDPLALVYERIVAGSRRRKLGTFFTPKPVLEYVRQLLKRRLRNTPVTIADPGAGVGAFTLGSLAWWSTATVFALDVNLVTLGLLATRPDLTPKMAAKGTSQRAKFVQQDFLNWIEEEWINLPGPKLILGNPPYVRHQQLTTQEKKKAQRACGELAPGLRAGLSTYFLAASLRHLDSQDSLCLLLPANWLEADYARPLRQHLWRSTRRAVELHIFDNDTGVFPGAQVPAMILFVGPEGTRVSDFTVHRIKGTIQDGFKANGKSKLNRENNIPNAFTINAIDAIDVKAPHPHNSIPLGSLTRIRRGVATGANSFFLRTLEEKNMLHPEHTVRAVSRLRDLGSDALDVAAHDQLGKGGARCWLLTPKKVEEDPELQRLLMEGEEAGVHHAYLCRQRTTWYQVEKIAPPDILIGPMGKDGFRIVLNECQAIPTNTLYGLRISPSYGSLSARRLARWLAGEDGQKLLHLHARQHGDGLLKLEPGSLARVPVPIEIVSGTDG